MTYYFANGFLAEARSIRLVTYFPVDGLNMAF